MVRTIDSESKDKSIAMLDEKPGIDAFFSEYNIKGEYAKSLEIALQGVCGDSLSAGFLERNRSILTQLSQVWVTENNQNRNSESQQLRNILEQVSKEANLQTDKEVKLSFDRFVIFLVGLQRVTMRPGPAAGQKYSSMFLSSISHRLELINQRIEEYERVIEANIELVLVSHRKINQGTNGVLYKFGIDEMSSELRQALEARNSRIDKDAAVKLLKVYSPGQGQHEFDMQMKAYQIVKNSPHPKRLAWVPKPIMCRDIEISDYARQKLNADGAGLTENKAEVLIMDFVEGDDLLKLLYVKALREHNKLVRERGFGVRQKADHEIEAIGEVDIPDDEEQLHARIAEVFHFPKTLIRAREHAEREHFNMVAFNENNIKVYHFLRQQGFRLNPVIVDQIKHTLELYRDQKFFHNDAHERNFLIVGDPEVSADENGSNTQSYIIDYGRAGVLPEGSNEDRDSSVIHRLKELLD